MELEIGIEDLLNKRKIESDRIEFKAGWNPDDIYHSVCAFANDYNNDGGGYIVIGVEEEKGIAKRPVKGIPEYMSDQTPFDCRANHKATFDDISPVLLENHLRKTGSKLAKQVRERGVEEILEDMQLLVGPPELRYIQNVAIMMFCEHPEKFFGYTYVQMTLFPKEVLIIRVSARIFLI